MIRSSKTAEPDSPPRAVGDTKLALRAQVAQLQKELDDARKLGARHERMLNSASKLARLGSWELDLATMDYVWSDGMFDLHELDRSFDYRDPASNIDQFYFPSDRTRVKNAVDAFRRDNRPFAVEARMRTASGETRWTRLTGEVEYIDGVPTRRFGVKQDITTEKAMLDQVARLAKRDDLTGLYKRSALTERLIRVADQDAERHRGATLFFVDLDGFKAINDAKGHAAGDACLIRIARRLQKIAVGDKVTARIGGDEFAVLVIGLAKPADQDEVASAIIAAINRPIRWDGDSFNVGASIGIAFRSTEETVDAAAMVREADLAMYAAKARGRNRAVRFSEELTARADQRKRMVAEALRDLQQARFAMYFQPKIRLSDGSLSGFEALLRWLHPDGTLAPGSFRAALDHPELALPFGRFTLNETLDQARDWHRSGLAFGHVAINIGAGQLADPMLAQTILIGLAKRGLPPSTIVVEVTEDAFLSQDTGPVHMLCRALKANGVSVSLDDFGTGYASLSHLRSLPVDELKIDRSFVERLLDDPVTMAIVKAIVGLASDLGHRVVAEGVETQAQADALRELGCEQAQGYLFGRPLPAVEAAQAVWGRPQMGLRSNGG